MASSNTQESGMWVVESAYTFDVNFINCTTSNAPILFQISRQNKEAETGTS